MINLLHIVMRSFELKKFQHKHFNIDFSKRKYAYVCIFKIYKKKFMLKSGIPDMIPEKCFIG